ncbi:MAG: hypothetical protein V8R24_03345 [Dorea longicatena]
MNEKIKKYIKKEWRKKGSRLCGDNGYYSIVTRIRREGVVGEKKKVGEGKGEGVRSMKLDDYKNNFLPDWNHICN